MNSDKIKADYCDKVKIMSRVQEHDNENDDEIRQRLPMVCKTDYYKSTLPTSREVSIG